MPLVLAATAVFASSAHASQLIDRNAKSAFAGCEQRAQRLAQSALARLGQLLAGEDEPGGPQRV
jgi:hypothetical protein